MAGDLIDVQKKLLSYDQKLLSLMVSRFEFISYMADAKYTISEDKDEIKIENKNRKEELLEFFKTQSLKLGKEKEFVNPEEFSKFIIKMTEEMLEFSWNFQKEYLKERYGVKKTI